MAIDECGTVQKSVYISNLARSILQGYIDTKTFFKLCKCVIDLTEEDLDFINRNITKDTIETDEDYIDDFRALGLMKEVNGGFDYTERAFLLRNYALDYEGQNDMPESFRERQINSIASQEEVDKMIEHLDQL